MAVGADQQRRASVYREPALWATPSHLAIPLNALGSAEVHIEPVGTSCRLVVRGHVSYRRMIGAVALPVCMAAVFAMSDPSFDGHVLMGAAVLAACLGGALLVWLAASLRRYTGALTFDVANRRILRHEGLGMVPDEQPLPAHGVLYIERYWARSGSSTLELFRLLMFDDEERDVLAALCARHQRYGTTIREDDTSPNLDDAVLVLPELDRRIIEVAAVELARQLQIPIVRPWQRHAFDR